MSVVSRRATLYLWMGFLWMISAAWGIALRLKAVSFPNGLAAGVVSLDLSGVKPCTYISSDVRAPNKQTVQQFEAKGSGTRVASRRVYNIQNLAPINF